MAYKNQVFPDARKRKVVVSVNKDEYSVLVARAAACTQGNVALYIRSQLFGEQTQAETKQAQEATT